MILEPDENTWPAPLALRERLVTLANDVTVEQGGTRPSDWRRWGDYDNYPPRDERRGMR